MLFLVNANDEEEVEVGAKSNYKSLMILEEVGLFFFGCVKECFFVYYYLFYFIYLFYFWFYTFSCFGFEPPKLLAFFTWARPSSESGLDSFLGTTKTVALVAFVGFKE